MMDEERSAAIARDFNRELFCLLGLPADNLTLDATKALLRDKTQQQGNIILSTINVNWVAQSWRDPSFRAAILNSDLVTLDGKPLVWLSRLMGYPMREVVAGSTLIDEINHDKTTAEPLTIFFFGGEDEAGRRAVERVNANRGGLKAVGWLNPGFGSVEEMSRPELIATVNQANPDILLVALGAKKGTAWIEHNRHRLQARIISHLGATVNFLAGTVRRAPQAVRNLGLEWVWRILQEPKLFSRYAADGLLLLRMLLLRLPLWLRYRGWQVRHSRQGHPGSGQWREEDPAVTLLFDADLQAARNPALRDLLRRAALADRDLVLDFQATKFMDGAFLGLLLLLQKQQQKNGRQLALRHTEGRPAQIFHLFGIPAP